MMKFSLVNVLIICYYSLVLQGSKKHIVYERQENVSTEERLFSFITKKRVNKELRVNIRLNSNQRITE